ncbi:porin [Psychromonas sp. psych-6C06]|uniref:porin n=1 Tax=Psychromonas sp. psych-6C06 TaxID=2058089 RepID=UPI000C32955A|nr:porin [Psychromonas sp. psych-6C06]PKF63082.1 porin [Psychromonas sp. psych-6C06]
MFKKTLVAAALTTAAFSASAYEIGVNDEVPMTVYGVAAISAVSYNVTDNRDASTGYELENESRVGFRAGKNMTDDLHVFIQVESGYVGNFGNTGPGASGSLGVRDTFVGLGGDWGKVRFGRVLTPMYELIDWPFSNPGLGIVFDWGGSVKGYNDRHSDQIRYDSPTWSGFNFAASTGRGDSSKEGSYFVGANAKYTISTVTLMAAYEGNKNFKGGYTDDATKTYYEGGDVSTYFLGFEAGLPGGFSIAGAYKHADAKDRFIGADWKFHDGDASQGSYSLIAQYWNGPLGLKAGYSATLDSEVNGQTQDDADSVVSFQVMGVINGFVPYARVAGRTLTSVNGPDADTDLVLRVGLEYGF